MSLPPNIELDLPVTEYHLNSNAENRFHEDIIQASALLSKSWFGRTDRPSIRFVVKNTPGKPGSGNALITRFGLENLGATGTDFPGEISKMGRGARIESAKPISDTTVRVEGGIYINYKGVFASDSSLWQKHKERESNKGQICTINSETTIDNIVKSIHDFCFENK